MLICGYFYFMFMYYIWYYITVYVYDYTNIPIDNAFLDLSNCLAP